MDAPIHRKPAAFDDARRSAQKRRAIVEAATGAFLRDGYPGTSMDQIAGLAHVSKQTVYKHFTDKESLFVEIVNATVTDVIDPVHEEVLRLRNSGDIEADLGDLARRQLRSVMQPQLLELRRLVIAEANRFPELGRTFYDRGPGRTMAALATVFQRLAARGVLRIEDPDLAAAHFNWLVTATPINQAMLLGLEGTPSPVELDRHATDGARAFLAAYGEGPAASDGRALTEPAR
jgi:TetR/AcrR family transcriptional repressor of mexJK operon